VLTFDFTQLFNKLGTLIAQSRFRF
jgi:hypothetical protein